MYRIQIIGAAKAEFDRIVKDLAGLAECDFKRFSGDLGAAPGEFTLVDIDLNECVGLASLKDWIARKPSGGKIIFVTDKSHLQQTRASGLGGTGFIHRPFDGEKLLTQFITGVAAPSDGDAPPLVPAMSPQQNLGAAVDGLDNIFAAASPGASIDTAMIQRAAIAVVDEIEKSGLASWVDTVRLHHSQTYQHCLLVTGVACAFARQLGLSRADRERLSFAGMLHDIGKARIPLAILEKPTSLDFAEMLEMRNHPQYGFDMLSNPQVVPAEMLDMVVHHHEYLDGSGYPHGLRAHEISDMVRMITISDIFGALIEKRAYKPAFTGAAAYKILLEMGGKLDNDLVREFAFAANFDKDHFTAAK